MTDTNKEREALAAYLKDCDENAIVPDVGGAWHAAFQAGRASLAASAPAPSEHIKEPHTLAEIKAKIASNDYSAELMLQHAMLHLDRLAESAGSEPVAVGISDPLDALRWGANVAETLLSIGRAIGFGRAQQILGEQWEAAHNCAPRGRMGVTVKDEATCQMCCGKPYHGCNTEFQGEAACRFTNPSPPEGAGWISVDERLPEPGQNVAFVVRASSDGAFRLLDGRVLGGRFLPGEGFSVPGLCVDASHWMPIPAPPASEAKGASNVD